MKRWMVAAVAGLAVVGGLVAPGPAQASSSTWYQFYRPKVRGSFSETAAISRNNIWSVGDTWTTAGKIIYRPFIRHYDGHAWKAVTIPGDPGFTSDWVSASSAKNVWVGGQPKGTRLRAGVIYRWNGTRWSKIPLPAQTELSSVTVLSPNNVWAYQSSGSQVPYNIFHWTGKKWHYYLPITMNFVPEGMSASGPRNVWVSGFKQSGKKKVVAAYRWNGTAWHSVTMPHPGGGYVYSSVTAVSASDVWIGWQTDTSRPQALNWDGSRWHTVAIPRYGNISEIGADGQGGYWFGATATLTGKTWVQRQLPAFTGGYSGVTRIPGTSSLLVNAGAMTGDETDARPTLYRIDL